MFMKTPTKPETGGKRSSLGVQAEGGGEKGFWKEGGDMDHMVLEGSLNLRPWSGF
jgi:hypothetical protein